MENYKVYGNDSLLEFINSTNGIQRFRVKRDTVFDMTVHGARGGHAQLDATRPGGFGAKVRTDKLH